MSRIGFIGEILTDLITDILPKTKTDKVKSSAIPYHLGIDKAWW